MKQIVFLMPFLVSAILASSLHAAPSIGGDSSAGGGSGGTLSVSNWNGALKLNVMTRSDGLVGTLLKYFEIAGARKVIGRSGREWLLERKGSGIIFETKSEDGSGEISLRSAFDLKPDQLLDIRYGNGLIILEFEGALAARLFEAMTASGLKPSSYLPNEDRNSNELGLPRSFRDGDLYCDRIGRVAGRQTTGPTCSLTLKKTSGLGARL